MICISRHSLDSWLLWYKESGVDRLRNKVQGRGAKSKISSSQKELQEAILKLRDDRNGGRIMGTDIQEMLHKNYNVKYHSNYIYIHC